MKISYNWLKDYIRFNQTPEELSVLLTDCGLEVESLTYFESIKGGLKNVVTGLVVSRDKHPNADKLWLTRVDAGTGKLLSVVCGAPNVAVGQKVIVALEGAELFTSRGPMVMRRTKIRGEISEGMICAEDELGIGESHEGILVLPDDTPIGMKASDYFKLETAFVYEIGLTPNRPDAASHTGVARDIAAVLNCRNLGLTIPEVKIKWPAVDHFKKDNNLCPILIEVENAADCPRYTGVSISGIQVKDSPSWLQNRLKSIGVRPINNVVDITNFVLFETGQPLHAFDADKITGGKVLVRKLPEGTAFVTLDGVERRLTGTDLMICNEDGPMCMAGIFGGLNSGVSNATKNVFLESACFNPVTIRQSSRNHGLKTDASFRFERGSDPALTMYAIKRAAVLIKEIAGGTISSDITDVYPYPEPRKKVEFHFDRFYRLTGKKIDRKIISNIFRSLEIETVSEENGAAVLAIPTNKVDVTRQADVAEEILRIYGYNNIEMSDRLNITLVKRQKPDQDLLRNNISDYLTSVGFYEVMTNSISSEDYYQKLPQAFSPAHCVKILNPLSKDLNVMRQTLLYGIMESLSFNKNRKNADLKFYEIGKTYKLLGGNNPYREENHLAIMISGKIIPEIWHSRQEEAGFYYLKSICTQVIERLGAGTCNWNTLPGDITYLNDGLAVAIGDRQAGICGRISKEVQQLFDIKDDVYYAYLNWDMLVSLAGSLAVRYREVPRFPSVRRDLALLVDKNVKFAEISRTAYESAPGLLREVGLFDVYEGAKIPEGKKSYAVSFILRDDEKTLTDEDIESTMNRISQSLHEKTAAQIR